MIRQLNKFWIWLGESKNHARLTLILTFITTIIAAWIGFIQLSINQKLFNLDFEPNLSLYLKKSVDPNVASGLEITNIGQQKIYFYEVWVQATSTQEEFIVDNSVPSTLSPGVSITIGDLAISNLFENAIKPYGDIDETKNVSVYFKTMDSQKYIMKTWVRIRTKTEDGQTIVNTYTGPIIYEKTNWKQK